MTPQTASALREAAYQLGVEASRADAIGQGHREQARAWESKAAGLRDAAALINRALAEEAS